MFSEAYALLMPLFLPRAHISNDLDHLVDAGVGLANLKYLLDRVQLLCYCLVTIGSDQDHAVNLLLESRNPVGVKISGSGARSWITEEEGIFLLASVEGCVYRVCEAELREWKVMISNR